MEKIYPRILLVLALVFYLPCAASASLVAIGDPVLGNSWTQRFYEDGHGDHVLSGFDKLEVFMLSDGDAFEAPGMNNFDPSGWASSLLTPQYILASGPITNLLYFNMLFVGDTSNTFNFDFLAWEGTSDVVGYHVAWVGSWQISAFRTDGSEYASRRAAVPIPAAVWLFGSGLLGLVGIRRRLQS